MRARLRGLLEDMLARMGSWPAITRDDLRTAAGTAGFDTTFPLLIRRLIAETGQGITELDMPGGSGTASGGFDGVVAATGQSAWVPAGTSVWELSVAVKSQAKADKDYTKRLAGPDGEDPAGLTYVQVILAPWTKARTWAHQRTTERRWKLVRGYNLDSVHAWLDSAPATAVWLAEQLGKALPGVRPAEDWWTDTWLPSTRIPLAADVVLAGREEAATSLMELLRSGQKVIVLSGELRVDEMSAFVAASLDEKGSPEMRARTLYVSDAHSLAQLVGQPQPLVLLLTDTGLAKDLSTRHAHQLIMLAPPGQSADVPVPHVDGQVVEDRLKAEGVAWEQAWSLGTLARRSLSALRRALALHPLSLTPTWARRADVVQRRLILLGSWDGASDGDRRIVAECIGRSYADVHETALQLASTPETPLLGRLDEQWHLLSPDDAWMLLGPQLTRDDLEAFRKVALRVLGERDPLIGLGAAERFAAQIGTARYKFSSTLREGLAQALALLGSWEEADIGAEGRIGVALARSAVRELLEEANADTGYALWTSLGDVLRRIAEAAPEEFLQAMRDGLKGRPPLHAKMFTDADTDEYGHPHSSPHTEFLWALELIAWAPDYFNDAVDVLARLAAIDPGGRWSNRPRNSLAEIFSVWAPNTSAGEQQRLQSLERLLRDEPDVARQLLIDLIPDGHGFQTVHSGPRFRNWKRETPVTGPEIMRVVTAVVDLLLSDLGSDPRGYLAFIEKIENVAPAQRAAFVEKITMFGASLTDDHTRAHLFDALREKVAHHQEYADAAWALPEQELRTLEQAVTALTPRSAVLRARWLFASDWVTLGDLARRDDFGAYDAALAERRAGAVGHVLAEGGLSAVAELADGTQDARLVGIALADNTSDLDMQMVDWLSDSEPSRPAVAYAYLVRRLWRGGTDLRDALLASTNDPAVLATILRATSDPPAAWKMLAELPPAVSERYWQAFSYFGLGSSFANVLEAAQGLSAAGRHAAALRLIALYAKQADSAEAAKVAASACEGILAGGLTDPELPTLARHDFQRTLALLARYRDEVGRQRVVNIEWQLFPFLGYESDAPTLHAALTEDPAFFAELVGYVYRRASDDTEQGDEEGDADGERERRRLVARRAYEVLRSWRTSPGTGPGGKIDLDVLRAWVTQAREGLGAADRLDVGDREIGQVLAFTPPDPDGMLPARAVRDLLEEIRSDNLERGLQIGLFNKRGVTSRGLHDGGKQEWDLAKTYRQQAEGSQPWPRTKRLLRRLADGYESDARREDAQAERRRRGLNEPERPTAPPLDWDF